MKRHWIQYLLLLAVVTVLTACDRSGRLEVVNRTRNRVFFSIDGGDYIVPGESKKAVSLDAGSNWNPMATVDKTYPLYIEGETFLMAGGGTMTEVKIIEDKTLNIYADPEYSCLKVINHCGRDIIDIHYRKYENLVWEISGNLLGDSILPDNEEFFEQVEPGTEGSPIVYRLFATASDYTLLSTAEVTLFLDDLLVLEATADSTGSPAVLRAMPGQRSTAP